MGKIFEVGNPKVTPRGLKNKPLLRYLSVQILGTSDQIGAKKIHVAG